MTNPNEIDALEHNPQGIITAAKERLDEDPFRQLTCGQTRTGRTLPVRKVLHALIDHAMTEKGKYLIAKRIYDLTKDAGDSTEIASKALADLAKLWIENFFLPLFTLASTRTVPPSESQTPNLEETAALIERASRGDDEALSVLLHRREGEKCRITGAIGFAEEPGSPSVGPLTEIADLEAAHILPYSLNNLNDQNYESTRHTWDMFKTWASIDIQKWVEQHLNGPGNAILLSLQFHKNFGYFRIWLEKEDKPNTYIVQVDARWTPLVHQYQGKIVTFEDRSNTGIPLPRPEALAMHASFAKALHASGATRFFETVLKEQEDVNVFAVDGSSTNLSVALRGLLINTREI